MGPVCLWKEPLENRREVASLLPSTLRAPLCQTSKSSKHIEVDRLRRWRRRSGCPVTTLQHGKGSCQTPPLLMDEDEGHRDVMRRGIEHEDTQCCRVVTFPWDVFMW